MANTVNESNADMEAACAIAIAQLLAENPKLAALWTPGDSGAFKCGFAAGATYGIRTLREALSK